MPIEERSADANRDQRWWSVTTSTSLPRATRRRTSSRPPRPGRRRRVRAPKRARRRGCGAGVRSPVLALPECPAAASRVCSFSTSTTGPGSRRRPSCSPSCARRWPRKWTITVVTGVLHEHEDQPRRERAERSRGHPRAIDVLRALEDLRARRQLRELPDRTRSLRGVRGPRPDIVLCMTDPPIIARHRARWSPAASGRRSS